MKSKKEHYQTWESESMYEVLIDNEMTMEEFLNSQWEDGYKLLGIFDDHWVFELREEGRKK